MVSESSVSDYALFGSQGVVLLLGQSSDCWLLDHRVSYRCWVSRQIAGCWTTGCRTTAGSVVRLLAVGPQGVVQLLGQSSDCWLLDHRLSSGCWVLDHRVSYRCWVSRQIAGCWTTGCRQVAGCWTTGCRTTAGSVVRLLAVGLQGIVRLLAVGSQGVVPLMMMMWGLMSSNVGLTY